MSFLQVEYHDVSFHIRIIGADLYLAYRKYCPFIEWKVVPHSRKSGLALEDVHFRMGYKKRSLE